MAQPSVPAPVSWTAAAERQKYIAATNVKIPIEQIVYDVDCSMGQIRPLSLELVEQKKKSVELNPPTGPIRDVLMWRMDATSRRYCVLGGQHTCAVIS